MYRSWLVALALLAGCDAVFGLAEPADRDAGVILPGDDGAPADDAGLDDGGPTPDAAAVVCTLGSFADLSGWATAVSGACTPQLCVLASANGAATVKLGAAGGLNSTLNPSVDFEGGSVAIEAIPGTTASSTSQLRIAMSASETLGIGIVLDSIRTPTLVVTHTSAGLTSTTMPTPYDALAHRHWQIAHVATAGGAALVVSTRATGAPGWTELTRVAAPADVSTTFAQLDVRRTTWTNDADPTGTGVVSFASFSLCGR